MNLALPIAVTAFLVLVVSASAVGIYGQVVVARMYAVKHAIRYGKPPPYFLLFSTPDGDAEVERWRKRTIRYELWSAGLFLAALIPVAIVAAASP